MRKVVLIAVVVLSTWIVTFNAVASQLTWDLESKDSSTYTTLIGKVRDNLKGKQLCFKIPMMAAPLNPEKYLVIDLAFKDDGGNLRKIYVAMSRSNAYVVGYSDNDKKRAFFLKDAPANKGDVFPKAEIVTLKYGGSYADLEKDGGNRKSLSLTRTTLRSRANAIFGANDLNDRQFKKNQAQFFLLVVQMVAEATRFNYIENTVAKNLESSTFVTDNIILDIVKDWSKISKAVENADKNGNFEKKTIIQIGGKTLTKVDEVREYIALLLYIKDPKCGKKKLVSHVITETVLAPILDAGLEAN